MTQIPSLLLLFRQIFRGLAFWILDFEIIFPFRVFNLLLNFRFKFRFPNWNFIWGKKKINKKIIKKHVSSSLNFGSNTKLKFLFKKNCVKRAKYGWGLSFWMSESKILHISWEMNLEKKSGNWNFCGLPFRISKLNLDLKIILKFRPLKTSLLNFGLKFQILNRYSIEKTFHVC